MARDNPSEFAQGRSKADTSKIERYEDPRWVVHLYDAVQWPPVLSSIGYSINQNPASTTRSRPVYTPSVREVAAIVTDAGSLQF